ncbi:MAG: type II toxin-antitoxin system VapC family toxin [Candidatus Sumerlaeaceae bacterium]|nr:type II toxin-antitoxin system VapC family toxin [Candidatus Sumerlaeaceae bacterium]
MLLWWRQGKLTQLNKKQTHALRQHTRSGAPMFISAITLWELAKLVERGRVTIKGPLEPWLEEIQSHPQISVLPITAQVAAESVAFGPNFSADPADQIIAATARCHGLALLTADEKIRGFTGLTII